MTESNSALNSFVQRIENLDDEIHARQDDRREVLAEAKSAGFDPRAIRIILAERKIARDEAKKRKADEVEAIAAIYRVQLALPF